MKPPKTTSTRELIPAGSHLAVCTMITEIGTHSITSSYGTKDKYQVIMSFDFPDHRIDIEKDGVTKSLPKRKSKKFTFSYHEKSNLGLALSGWNGERPASDFDLSSMLGKNAMITIIHSEWEGSTYDNIQSISGLPSRMEGVKAETELISFSFTENGVNIPTTVPEWVADKIKASKEWAFIKDAGEKLADSPPMTSGADEEDVPF